MLLRQFLNGMLGENITCMSEVIYMQIVVEFHLQVWASNCLYPLLLILQVLRKKNALLLWFAEIIHITGTWFSTQYQYDHVWHVSGMLCILPHVISVYLMFIYRIDQTALDSIFWCLLYTLKCAALITVKLLNVSCGGEFAHPWKSELSKNLGSFIRDMHLWHSSSGIIWQLLVC